MDESSLVTFPPRRRERSWLPIALLLALFAVTAALRIAAPTDLLTGDQPLQVAYINDIVQNGAWIVQHLESGAPASKPPLYNWLAAAPIVATGSSSEFLLKLPSLVAALLTLLLVWRLGTRLAGRRAGLVAAALLCVSPLFVKHMYFARTDMLLTMLVVAQMYAAVARRPVVFWSAAALSWLTKGPVGVILPIIALSALWWWNGELRERWREMRLARGFVLALVPFAIWFAAALYVGGDAVYEQLVVAETIDRFSAESTKSKENRPFYYYVPHFLARMAPVSFFFICAAFAARGARAHERSNVAIAIAWVLAMLVVFSIVPSKRADRLFPILPGVCIAAAWVIDRELAKARSATRRVFMSLGAIIGLTGLALLAAGPLGRPLIPNEPLALTGGAGLIATAVAMLLLLRKAHILAATAALIVALLIGNTVYQHGIPERTEDPREKIKQRERSAARSSYYAERTFSGTSCTAAV